MSDLKKIFFEVAITYMLIELKERITKEVKGRYDDDAYQMWNSKKRNYKDKKQMEILRLKNNNN